MKITLSRFWAVVGHALEVRMAVGFSGDHFILSTCYLVNYREIPDFLRLIKSTDGIFAYYSDVLGVKGNFDR